MNGPEERWEDQQLWDEERRHEEPRPSKDEIAAIKADEAYDDGR